MEKEKQKADVGLAQLAAEQRFDEFDAKFRSLVDQHMKANEELNALRSEFQKYNNIIKALEQK